MQDTLAHFTFRQPRKKKEADGESAGSLSKHSDEDSNQPSNLSIQSRAQDRDDDSDVENRNGDSATFRLGEPQDKKAGSFKESSSSVSQIVCLTASQPPANVSKAEFGVRTKKNYMNDQLN